MNHLERLLRDHLATWHTGWSMGSFGAVAEFHQDEGEVAVIDEPHCLTRATRRGAVSIDRRSLDDVTAIAYETLRPRRHRWSQAVALCMTGDLAERAGRRVLTELGPDDGAVRGIDRMGILFDMGLSLPQCDFCIRTTDPRLLAVLRANVGRSVLDPASTAMPAILRSHPHRVSLTAIGRIEVYQKIGGPDTGGVSPPGPHTHVLPKLLRSGRTHSANTPIPNGLMPVAFLHPGNPVISAMGDDRPFDRQLHANFQQLLLRYGPPEMILAKERVRKAIAAGQAPSVGPMPGGRFERAAVRLALRQMLQEATAERDTATLEKVRAWLVVYETAPEEMADDDAPGH